MICLSVKCLSRQPGSVYTKQGQGSLLFNCQHIPQPGVDPQQGDRWQGLGDGPAALPSGHSGYNQPVLGEDGLHELVRVGGETILLPETVQTR